MKNLLPWLTAAVLTLTVTSCEVGTKSGRGFRLPEGNIEKGKAAFVSLKCNTCHPVNGIDLPPPASASTNQFILGGEVSRVRTYGELVTSVINPSHGLAPGFKKERISEGHLSPMPEFNEVMTVGQMIDLVTFLQSCYTQLEPDYLAYP